MTQEEGENLEKFVSKTLNVAKILKELGVAGFVFNAMFLMKKEDLVAELKEMGFLVFTYGDLNNTKEGVWHQLDLRISGLCTDMLTGLNETIRREEKERTAVKKSNNIGFLGTSSGEVCEDISWSSDVIWKFYRRFDSRMEIMVGNRC
jgi:hypothetical protein